MKSESTEVATGIVSRLTRRRFLRAIDRLIGLGGMCPLGACTSPRKTITVTPARSTSTAAASPVAGASPVASPGAVTAVVASPAPAAAPSPIAANSPVAASPSPSVLASPPAAPVAGRPMYQLDLRHTGRSPHAGPRWARVLRRFDTTNPGVETPEPGDPRPDVQCSAAIAPDGTIYIGTFPGNLPGASNGNFYAITPDGQLRWLYEAEREVAGIWSTAALGADGATLYFGANKGGIYALSRQDGAFRWRFNIVGSVYSSPTSTAGGSCTPGTRWATCSRWRRPAARWSSTTMAEPRPGRRRRSGRMARWWSAPSRARSS